MAPRIPKRNTYFINPEAESSRGRSVLEAMRGYAGVPSQASVMYPGTQRGYEAGELAGMAEMLIPGASLAKGALGAALAGVIKPRGGNWISGDVESSISNLLPLPRGYTERMEVPDRGSVRYIARDPRGDILEVREYLQEVAPQREALQRWIEGPLTKYIKRDLATPEDPVRKLADQGISHMRIPENPTPAHRTLADFREFRGYPREGLSLTPGGSQWENLSDSVIDVSSARQFQNPSISWEREKARDNPWIEKLAPDDPVYNLGASSLDRPLGFGHLVDELNNALNPESGLPRNLLLRPEQMQQMGMEKAVRHVDAVNKWRAAQRAEANAELANRAMVIREYAENNPKGLRWMELKVGDPDENMLSSLSPSDRARYERYLEKGDSPLEAMRASMGDQNPLVKELEKQLKYEGDTMGHCVGGYCPDVLEGKSRIFSLRDAKGEPHVTVEVGNYNAEDLDSDTFAELVGDRERSFKIMDEFTDSDMGEFGDFGEFLRKRYPEIARKLPGGHEIVQVKGKQNLAPKDEYLPFVQDFVRNNPLGGGWGSVGDLRNTNLVDISGFPKRVEALGSQYVTEKELNDYLDKFGENGMAEGGLVAQPDYFDDLDAFLRR